MAAPALRAAPAREPLPLGTRWMVTDLGCRTLAEARAALEAAHERRERREIARLRRADPTCEWCGRAIGEQEDAIMLGGRLLHRARCLADFDSFTRREE